MPRRTRPRASTRGVLEVVVRVQVGYSGDVVGLQHAIDGGDAEPRPSEMGNITAPDPSTRRPPSGRISVSPMAEWPRPRKWPISWTATDFEIEPIRVTCRGRRPLEYRVEENVGLDELTGFVVEEERRGTKDPFHLRVSLESNHRQTFLVERLGGGEAGKLNSIDAVGTSCHVVNARERRLEGGRRDAERPDRSPATAPACRSNARACCQRLSEVRIREGRCSPRTQTS